MDLVRNRLALLGATPCRAQRTWLEKGKRRDGMDVVGDEVGVCVGAWKSSFSFSLAAMTLSAQEVSGESGQWTLDTHLGYLGFRGQAFPRHNGQVTFIPTTAASASHCTRLPTTRGPRAGLFASTA